MQMCIGFVEIDQFNNSVPTLVPGVGKDGQRHLLYGK